MCPHTWPWTLLPPGGCLGSGLGSLSAACLALTRCGEGRSRSRWLCLQRVLTRACVSPHREGLPSCVHCGACFFGICPRVLTSVAALGFQCPIAPRPSHQRSGTWGTGVGGPAPFGSPQVLPSFQALGSCLGATVLPGVFREVGTDFTPGVRRRGCLV